MTYRPPDQLEAAALHREFEELRAALGAGQIFNCAFADRLRTRSAAGDGEATRALASMAPQDAPRRAVQAWRDAQIRLIAADLFAALPGVSNHAVAAILDQAGRDLAGGRGISARKPFGRLIPEERARLEAQIRDVLEVASWPGLRQIEKIF
jgi:hypothetical protein